MTTAPSGRRSCYATAPLGVAGWRRPGNWGRDAGRVCRVMATDDASQHQQQQPLGEFISAAHKDDTASRRRHERDAIGRRKQRLIVASKRSVSVACYCSEMDMGWMDPSIRYDTRRCFNVRSKANTSQLNLPHGTDD